MEDISLDDAEVQFPLVCEDFSLDPSTSPSDWAGILGSARELA